MGLIVVCPECRKTYETVLEPKNLNLPIQKAYPDAKDWEREQLITGICSNECWDSLWKGGDGSG